MSTKEPTALDVAMIDRVLELARSAIAQGKAGVAALMLWRDETLAFDHNQAVDTGDLTAHAEMVVLRQASSRLSQMSDAEKAEITLYVTLEPCLMCLSAISFAGIKRVVYSALNRDGKPEIWISDGITTEEINETLVRGPLELVPGVKREEGQAILDMMGKKA